ncbi:MAG: toxin-antitoxin system HicB family antitoxin, partial [Thermanaeromonas sp.]|uniref:toxin-antitoxin system HicB family antitoxin n=1 Tax=Thermanaeromonas sp. TaxID=2003697 RepID=UPI00243DC9F9
MKENSRFVKRLMVRIPEKLERRLRAEATRRGLSVANLVRDILEQALSEEAAGLAAREGREALEEVVRKAIKPEMDRLAKLISR